MTAGEDVDGRTFRIWVAFIHESERLRIHAIPFAMLSASAQDTGSTWVDLQFIAVGRDSQQGEVDIGEEAGSHWGATVRGLVDGVVRQYGHAFCGFCCARGGCGEAGCEETRRMQVSAFAKTTRRARDGDWEETSGDVTGTLAMETCGMRHGAGDVDMETRRRHGYTCDGDTETSRVHMRWRHGDATLSTTKRPRMASRVATVSPTAAALHSAHYRARRTASQEL